MGKTRTKVIDDSKKDELVEKLKKELGIKEEGEVRLPPKESVPKGADRKPSKARRSRKYLDAGKELDRSKVYSLDETLDMVKKMSYSKFNGTLEAHINTVQTGLRGFLHLPFASGKKLRILAFGKGAEQSGADLVGSDSTLDEIEKGHIKFDLIITTPEWMSKLTKVAKVLGPKGLMPNPKNNTIASGQDGLKKAVESFQTGKTEYKTEAKTPIIHLSLGKLNQPNEELTANVKTLLQTIGKTKIKKVTLSPTMGPGVKLDLASI
ncbi:50S ribosomal protein L1 [Candidatus Daviesbacteria bacterium]|nr:50S ribosomal protein L1 [Candidatus Daviesbacteria bacterium]